MVSGIHLDRPWPDLGPEFGEALRAWSREALARIVDAGRHRGADAIVVAGDLLDRSTVLPETVEYAASVLSSFPGSVLLAPGPADWIGEDSPYELASWPANMHIWTNAAFEPAPELPSVWGSAWTSPAAQAPRIRAAERADGHRIFVRAHQTAPDLDALSPGDRAVVSDPGGSDQLLVVPSVVDRPGGAGGSGLLVDIKEPEAPAETIDLPGRPGSVVELDVTGLEQPDEFELALRSRQEDNRLLCVRLTGALPAQILLPGFGDPEVRSGVVLDMDALTYAVEVPEASDRSTRAEFLRAMALTRGEARTRHQTTALGLKALAASSTGA
jgi:hypothetical protein